MVMSSHVSVPLAADSEAEFATVHDHAGPISRHVHETARLQAVMAPVLLHVQRIGRSGPSENDFAAVNMHFTEFLDGMKRWYVGVNKKQGESLRRCRGSSLTTYSATPLYHGQAV